MTGTHPRINKTFENVRGDEVDLLVDAGLYVGPVHTRGSVDHLDYESWVEMNHHPGLWIMSASVDDPEVAVDHSLRLLDRSEGRLLHLVSPYHPMSNIEKIVGAGCRHLAIPVSGFASHWPTLTVFVDHLKNRWPEVTIHGHRFNLTRRTASIGFDTADSTMWYLSTSYRVVYCWRFEDQRLHRVELFRFNSVGEFSRELDYFGVDVAGLLAGFEDRGQLLVAGLKSWLLWYQHLGVTMVPNDNGNILNSLGDDLVDDLMEFGVAHGLDVNWLPGADQPVTIEDPDADPAEGI